MRFVHTSDWHLGRTLHEARLTGDQEHALEGFLAFVKEARPDAVLVSGDVYDRSVPPVEAVSLLEDVLERLVLGLGVPTIVIAGNHDSPERLAFGAKILRERGLHLFGPVEAAPGSVVLEDAHGPVAFHALPYAEPSLVRVATGMEMHDHDAATRERVARVRRSVATRHVLLAHAFVVGGEESESERPLSVGGAGTVDASAFGGFGYVALGHLHRPQRVGADDRVRYSGSLLKYSFSEADHQKGVLLVEIDARGDVHVEEVALPTRRDLRVVEGEFFALLEEGRRTGGSDDYLKFVVTNKEALLDPMGRLREVYPNALELVRREAAAPAGGMRVPRERTTDLDLFSDFFSQATHEPLTDEERRTLAAHLERLKTGPNGAPA